MIKLSLDKNKKWRMKHWNNDVDFIYFNNEYDGWSMGPKTGRYPRNIDDELSASDMIGAEWVEYQEPQPEPELEWRCENNKFYLSYRPAFEVTYGDGTKPNRPATEAELRAIRKSLGIKGE